jgi:hypothetical protein
MRLKPQIARVGFFAVLAVTPSGQPSALNPPSVAMFLRELQRAVARDDRAAVSALVQYPLTVSAGGVRIPISDPASLRQNYEAVFSPPLKSLIAQATVPPRRSSTPSASVVITADFATIGEEAVRIARIGDGLKITKITVPLAAPTVESGAGVSRRGSREPEKLLVDVGRIQRAGALGGGERDVYLLSAQKNRLLEVRITGVSGRDIVARISSVKTRAPIDARTGEGMRTWIGRIPDAGDYRIEVVRPAPGGAPRLDYLMVVSVR